jgi:hypothetical protein
MLPTTPALLQGYAFFARRRGGSTPEAGAVQEAVDDARRLAEGRERDEPAALFYVLAKAPSLGWRTFVEQAAMNHAHALRLRLEYGAVDLADLRLDVAEGRVTFEDVRAWFEARLMPLHG